MSYGDSRSDKITRRTFGALALALGAFAAVRLWPRDPLGVLAARPDAAALKALGRLPVVQPAADLEERLRAKLAGSTYDAARTKDALTGAMVDLDGWQVPETTVLAATWLARQDG